MEHIESKKKVYLVACIFSLTVGLSFLAAKTSMEYASPLDALAIRFIFAFLFALLLVFTGIIKIKFKGKPIKKLLIPSIFYSIGFFGFQFFGLKFATSIEGGIVFAVMPVFTMIFAEIFLKEKPNIKQRSSVVISIVGVLVLFITTSGDINAFNFMGIALLFASSLFMAGNNVMVRWIRKDFTPAEISFAACALGAVFYTTIIVFKGMADGTIFETVNLFTERDFVISTLYLGIACTMLTTLMSSYMMANMEAVKTSVFGNISTLISIVVGAVILNEPLHWYHLVCAVLIILGVLGTNGFAEKKNMEKKHEKI